MSDKIKVAIVGLDTSHSVEFPRSMNSPDCPECKKIAGMTVTKCLRFSTPFQSEEGLDNRQKQLEAWGVKVVTDFDEAVADCDAMMLEINDPAYHLDYFKRAAKLGKPVFLDKPMADTLEHAKVIYDLAKTNNMRVFSASSLRFVSELIEASASVPEPTCASVYGPLGKAPAGSSIVWYGVHSFEMLERAMGRGAKSVQTIKSPSGAVCLVEYADNKRGVVELTEGNYLYGGHLRTNEKAASYQVDMSQAYTSELKVVEAFFKGNQTPCAFEDSLEVMAMLDAAEKSFQADKPVKIEL